MDSPDKRPPSRSKRKLLTVAGRVAALAGLGGLLAYGVNSRPGGSGTGRNPEIKPVAPVPTASIQPESPVVPVAATATSERPREVTNGQSAEMPAFIPVLDGYQRKRAERISGTSEIIGAFPENLFGDDIKKNNLIPAVFLNETTEKRIDSGFLYLGHVFELLSKRPELRGPKLRELGINTPNNLPLNFSPEATIFEVLAGFVNRFAHRNVEFNTSPNLGVGLFGTMGDPFFAEGYWQLKAKTNLNKSLLDERASKEENNTAYYQTTNLQFALAQLHEYIHFNQDEALMAEIVKDGTLMNQIGQDAGKMRQAIGKKAAEHKLRVIRQNGLPDNSRPNEAQANAISQLLLFTLSKINKTDRFPGAESDDPYPVNSNSLQRVYRSTVLSSGALNKDWQQRHAA